jgi:hypothetical protein
LRGLILNSFIIRWTIPLRQDRKLVRFSSLLSNRGVPSHFPIFGSFASNDWIKKNKQVPCDVVMMRRAGFGEEKIVSPNQTVGLSFFESCEKCQLGIPVMEMNKVCSSF